MGYTCIAIRFMHYYLNLLLGGKSVYIGLFFKGIWGKKYSLLKGPFFRILLYLLLMMCIGYPKSGLSQMFKIFLHFLLIFLPYLVISQKQIPTPHQLRNSANMPKIWEKRRIASVKIAVLSTPSLKPTSEHMLIWREGDRPFLGLVSGSGSPKTHWNCHNKNAIKLKIRHLPWNFLKINPPDPN